MTFMVDASSDDKKRFISTEDGFTVTVELSEEFLSQAQEKNILGVVRAAMKELADTVNSDLKSQNEQTAHQGKTELTVTGKHQATRYSPSVPSTSYLG